MKTEETMSMRENDLKVDSMKNTKTAAKASRSIPSKPDVRALMEEAMKAEQDVSPAVPEAARKAASAAAAAAKVTPTGMAAAKAAEAAAEKKPSAVQKAAPVLEKKPQAKTGREPAAKHTSNTPSTNGTALSEKSVENKTAHLSIQQQASPVVSDQPKLVFGVKPVLPYSIEEAVNRLRININFLGADVKRIMVVSSEPNEGKSFVAMNLWKQMAVAGEKSLLVDLDMRKSNMAAKFRLSRSDGRELKGTSHFLSGKDRIQDMILSTEIPEGDILPNVDNIVNPSMLLESRKFNEMMAYGEQNYRYTFLDVPPLGLVSDGELIGNMCDGAILCVRGGMTPRGVVRNSIRQLERAGCPVLGIVLNRVGGSGSKYYHKYYGKKYYYNDQYYQR